MTDLIYCAAGREVFSKPGDDFHGLDWSNPCAEKPVHELRLSDNGKPIGTIFACQRHFMAMSTVGDAKPVNGPWSFDQ